jgi:hypothetical protein
MNNIGQAIKRKMNNFSLIFNSPLRQNFAFRELAWKYRWQIDNLINDAEKSIGDTIYEKFRHNKYRSIRDKVEK